MKDPAFLSSPVYPPILSSNYSLSTNRDDHSIPLLSHNRFIFKSQLNSLYMLPTDYTSKLNDKNQDFVPSLHLKSCRHTNIGLITAIKIFLCNSPLFARHYLTLKRMKMIRHSSQLPKNYSQ